MALWTMNDEEAGKPKYLSDNLVNGQTVSDKDATVGVDVAEAQNPTNRAKGIKTPGWTKYVTYVDAQGRTRNKAEILVAAGGNMTGDGDGAGIDIGTGGGGPSIAYPVDFTYAAQGSAYDGGYAFTPDGTQFTYNVMGTVYTYTLSTPWDVSTMSGTPIGNFGMNVYAAGIRPGIVWGSDGLSLQFSNSFMGMYAKPAKVTLTTPYDVNTINGFVEGSLTLANANCNGPSFSADGLTAYTCANGDVYQYALAVAFDWTTATTMTGSYNLTGNLGLYNVPGQIAIAPGGLVGVTYQSGAGYNGVITQFELSVPYDITSINAGTALHSSLTAGITYVSFGGLTVNPAFDKVYVGGTPNMMNFYAYEYNIV